ncbi:hypothetical protein [Rhodovulum sp. BSW8]|uniref:hypothetical protein n=1 Tax=Rhodovulum sp. BSW8 TaxID=2259645 RepID=UPI001402DEDE|nr:hypothetical protein [Rhodovulum sp. BSW8]
MNGNSPHEEAPGATPRGAILITAIMVPVLLIGGAGALFLVLTVLKIARGIFS